MKLHRHMEDRLWFITDGADFDCPPERGCWFEGEPDEIGRQVCTEEGAIWREEPQPEQERPEGRP